MQLFTVKNESFDNKQAAKAFRNINGGCVSIGKDHWRYGLSGNAKTHSHNAKSGGHGTGFPKGKR